MESNEEIEKIIIEYEKYVKSLVRKYKVSHYDQEDLYQAGLVGLFKAIKHYKKDYHTKLSTYAFKYILGEINKEYSNLSIYGKVKYNKIRVYINNNPKKTSEEIIRELNITKDAFFIALSNQDKVEYLTEDMIEAITDESKSLTIDLSKDDEILYNYYFHHKLNQHEIAKILNLSQSTVSRRIKLLKEHLKLNANS